MNSSIVAQTPAPVQSPRRWVEDMGFDLDATPASAFEPTDLDCWDPAPAQDAPLTETLVSPTVLRLRWEASQARLNTLLARYAAGQCGPAIVEAAEQAEDRAYNAYQAAVA